MLLAGNGCRRRPATVTGRLLENCDGAPVAGQKITLYPTKMSGKPGQKFAETTTDANGYFTLSFEWVRHRSVMVDFGDLRMEGIPTEKNINIGTVYQQRTAPSVIRVKVNNAYASVSDILSVRYDVLGGATYTMHTPLHDTIFPAFSPQDYESNGTVQYSTYKNAKQQQEIEWSFTSGFTQTKTQEVPYCNGVPDTIVVTID